MTRAELIALAEVEDRMAQFLHTFSAENPLVHSAYEAGLVCVNRAAALRAITEGMNDD
jgi:hypothetical protein